MVKIFKDRITMFSKKTPYMLSIPNPCHENWAGMTSVEKGRFCAACNTVVKDFADLTDAEIIDELKQSNGKLCGRFSETQLNRELEAKRFLLSIPRPGGWGRIAASVLLFHAFINQVSAQQKSAPVAQHITSSKTAFKANADTTNIIIKGKVLDYHSQLPLKKLEVEIKGTQFSCVTDKYGRFKFQLPDYFKEKAEVVIIPAASAYEFLDTTASIIPEVKVAVDSFPLKCTVNLYRYPLETISVTELATSVRYYSKGLIVSPVDLNVDPARPVGTVSIEPTPARKESSLQKFLNFFRKKKSKT